MYVVSLGGLDTGRAFDIITGLRSNTYLVQWQLQTSTFLDKHQLRLHFVIVKLILFRGMPIQVVV